jgi:excisionase family DNA binding protein
MDVDVVAEAFSARTRDSKMTEPLAYTVSEACLAARAGRSAIYDAIRSGALRAVKHGRRTLILADDLRRYLESLPRMEVK